MIKKINTKQLKPGMFIKDLNCSWLEHPFFGSSLKVSSGSIIEKIIGLGIREVYIDTAKGIDIDDPARTEEVKDSGNGDRTEAADTPDSGDEPVDDIGYKAVEHVTLGEEIHKAKKIKEQAMMTVRSVMSDIKSGRQIERDKVEGTVDDIILSVLRNQDALTSLGRLRKVDEYLFTHSISVSVLMIAFGKYLGFEPRLLRDVGIAGLLHDVGIITVSPEILNKKSTLSEDEFMQVKTHVENTREILEKTDGINEASIMTAYHHHERLDGSGYPRGLRGDEISYTGQVMAIVDIYDALSTKRCYRRKIPPTQAMKILYDMSEKQLNRELVQKFIRCIGIYPAGSLVRLANGLIGIVIRHNEGRLLHPVVRVVYNANTKRYIAVPYDMDLSRQSESGADGRIVGYEQQDEWEIQPELYM